MPNIKVVFIEKFPPQYVCNSDREGPRYSITSTELFLWCVYWYALGNPSVELLIRDLIRPYRNLLKLSTSYTRGWGHYFYLWVPDSIMKLALIVLRILLQQLFLFHQQLRHIKCSTQWNLTGMTTSERATSNFISNFPTIANHTSLDGRSLSAECRHSSKCTQSVLKMFPWSGEGLHAAFEVSILCHSTVSSEIRN